MTTDDKRWLGITRHEGDYYGIFQKVKLFFGKPFVAAISMKKEEKAIAKKYDKKSKIVFK